MTIAIYETVHLECLLPLCELLWDSGHTVHIFTSENFKTDLLEVLQEQFKCFNWTFLPAKTDWRQHYNILYVFFKEVVFDFILLNSLESRHLLLFVTLLFTKNKNVVLNLHDVNTFFKAGLSKEIKGFLRTISKKMLNTLVKAFVVNAQEMKVFMKEHSYTKKPVFWLPHVISKALPPVNRNTEIVITVPGSIDNKRRDYIAALDVFEMLHNHHMPTKMVLAGRPIGEYGDAIISKCQQLRNQGKNIIFFKHEIDEKMFQTILSKSNFILSPIKINTTIQDNIPEIYGASKFSGNIYDAIRHGKILLAPSTLHIPAEIETSTIFYNSTEQLVAIVKNLTADPKKLFKLQNEAYQNAMKFTRSEYAKRFYTLLTIAK